MLLIFDALGLALFTIVGCEKALAMNMSYTVIVMMGIVTGVAGGIIRDLFCDEIPMVFKRGELYATAAFVGCLVFIALVALGVYQPVASLIGVMTALLVRLAALRWKIKLPLFVVRDSS